MYITLKSNPCSCLPASVMTLSLEIVAVVQPLSSVLLSVTPRTAAHRVPLSSAVSQICSNSYALSLWCYLTISSYAIPFFFYLQSFPGSGSFPVSEFFVSGGQSFGASASASILPLNIQNWFPIRLIGLISLLSKTLKSLLQLHSTKVSFLQGSAFFTIQLSHLNRTTGKTVA